MAFIAVGPSTGSWSWGAGLGAATAAFSTGGYAETGYECRTQIAEAFRGMLA